MPDDEDFDKHWHFMRKDVISTPQGVCIKLKWAKNMQCSMQPQIIPLPQIHPTSMDPFTTYNNMCLCIPAPRDGPLLILPNRRPLTVKVFRSAFASLCQQIGIDSELYSCHSLRRGGASYAYTQGASQKDIQRHGAWSSSTYWEYIVNYAPQDSTVCAALAR